jgi:hypothetical protein
MIYITCVYEDEPSHQAMLKMLSCFPDDYTESAAIPCHGFGKIRKNIVAYNLAARHGHYFVLTDLDAAYKCAQDLINQWLPYERSPQLIFRIAIHEIESWFLADRDSFASFFSVSKARLPLSADTLPDPKQTVFNLVRRSRKRQIREAILPIDKDARIGPGYNTEFCDFIQNYWNIERARLLSPSLDKAMAALEKMTQPNRRPGK